MAYMGRGGFSSFGRGGASGGISTDNNSEDTKNQGI